MDVVSLERHIPSTLYEIIAYFGSGSIFVVLGLLAIVDPVFIPIVVDHVCNLDLPEQICLLTLLGSLTYAYGQLSSTLSAPFIADIVGKIVRRLGIRVSADFRLNFTEVVRKYGLDEKLPPEKMNNKWTLMFYLQVKAPDIGRDIMKRYAREKLARINAFNMLVLIVLAVISNIGAKFGLCSTQSLRFIFRAANPWWLAFYLILLCAFSYEYYKRKCWNNDLLIKVLPVADIT